MTIMNKTIKELEAEGYSGVDADLATSLFEYGLAWKACEDTQGEPNQYYRFIYGVDIVGKGNNPTRWKDFDYSLWNEDDFYSLQKEPWFNRESVLSFAGMADGEDFLFPRDIDTFISYYGTDNIFGSSYSSFEITEQE